ncbi:MAG: hypothetical protein QOJ07_78 [Thermoleophilaceae bacterium]|nr:hypothetical protein [Thermoleophilaceae bacterium]
MLEGVDANRIIVGGYTDGDGGVCPMLAAHRNGGRTSLASFARAWDRYTGGFNGPREASERELRTLRFMLETSLIGEESTSDLAAAVADLKASKARRAREDREGAKAPRRDTGERDRTGELRKRHGWAWMRIFRRYDTYKAALDQVEADERAARSGPDRERELSRN